MSATDEREFWDAATREPDGGRLAIWGEPGEWEPRIADCFEACVRPVVDALAPRAGAQLHVADIGCGIGRLTVPAALAMPDATVWGVDVSARMILGMEEHAAKSGATNVRGAQCDGRSLPIECAALDGAFSMVVFQHIPWHAVCLYFIAVARALRPGGIFRFQFVEGDQSEERSHHFPVDRVVSALTSVGLSVTAIDRGLMYDSWVFCTARKWT